MINNLWSKIRDALPNLKDDFRKALEAKDYITESIYFNKITKTLVHAIENDKDNRCIVMLKNTYGYERCGRKDGHEGKCCYQTMD